MAERRIGPLDLIERIFGSTGLLQGAGERLRTRGQQIDETIDAAVEGRPARRVRDTLQFEDEVEEDEILKEMLERRRQRL